MADRVAVRAVVHGGVQGVGFRWSTAREASRWGVCGWVRNLDDGTVEVHAEGRADQVGPLISWLHDGPRFASVARVDTRAVPVEGFASFQVEP